MLQACQGLRLRQHQQHRGEDCANNLHSCWTAPAKSRPVLPCQAALYQACVDAGITLLSIGHRPAIKAFHQAVIHFQARAPLAASAVVMLWRV